MRRPLLIVACIFLFALTYSFMVRTKIASHAKLIAAGQPYCIMVPSGNGYKLADNYFDTMGLLMRGSSNRNHAILVIGYKESHAVYHWSYLSNRFLEGAYGPLRYNCAQYKFDYENLQHPDFLEKMSVFANNKNYMIPLIYQPTVTGDSGIGLVARLPNFQPVKELCSDRTCNMIHATKKNDTPLYVNNTPPKNETMYFSLRAYGLETGRYISKNLPQIASGLPYGTYYAKDHHGNISTVVHCLGSSDVQCLLQFDRGEIRYSLHVMPKDLGQWKTIEDKVVDFIESFVEPSNHSVEMDSPKLHFELPTPSAPAPPHVKL